ncbi:hypothetical protein Tco_0878102 [Tanacetum coccineum]|uniref:Uncharacterized protein n=1 Tax=Tanacetum coccineum TaxID=301880 RepID=A0ABQ5BZR1_9ASTR
MENSKRRKFPPCKKMLRLKYITSVLLHLLNLSFMQNIPYALGISVLLCSALSILLPFDASKEAVMAIAIANESGITKGARYFRAKVYYIREVIEFGDIKLEKVYTDDNLADPFTKVLAFPKHSELTRNIGMLPASSLM